MTTITKEQLIADIAHAEEKAKSLCGPCADDHVRLAHWLRIALASMKAEPMAYADPQSFDNFKSMGGKNAACTKEWMWRYSGEGLIPLFTAPPVPATEHSISENSVHDLFLRAKALMYQSGGSPIEHSLNPVDAWLFEAERAANKQAEPVSPAYKLPEERREVNGCWCHACRPVTMSDMRFVVCPDCGNKRCPKANNHRNSCTGSNEPGQAESAYQKAPRPEAKR